MTKEELIAENARLKEKLSSRDIRNEATLSEFANILGCGEPLNSYSRDKKTSWERVFCEVGKLLAFQRKIYRDEEIDSLNSQVRTLREKLGRKTGYEN